MRKDRYATEHKIKQRIVTHTTRKANVLRKLAGETIAAAVPVFKARHTEPAAQLAFDLGDVKKPKPGFLASLAKAREIFRGAFKPFASARSS